MPIVLKALFFTAAVVCFAIDAVRGQQRNGTRWAWALIPTGLALFVIPFAVDAWDAVE